MSEIHERVSGHLPGLGVATVYRTVKALGEKGEVSVAELPGEEPRYKSSGLGNHHFRCRPARTRVHKAAVRRPCGRPARSRRGRGRSR